MQFQQIIDLGYKDNPEPVLDFAIPKTRGRKKRPKPLNLILRLDLQREQVLGFMYDFVVPFDNNLAERDIRMTKLKLKTSGCFRSLKGAKSVFEKLSEAFEENLNHANIEKSLRSFR